MYLILSPEHVKKMIQQSEEKVITFAFGDSVNEYKNLVAPYLVPNSIEAMSLMLKRLINSFGSDFFLVDDAYIMQSYDPTPLGKGAALKAFVSEFSNTFKRLNKTMIFVSEGVDYTVARQIRKLNIKIKI